MHWTITIVTLRLMQLKENLWKHVFLSLPFPFCALPPLFFLLPHFCCPNPLLPILSSPFPVAKWQNQVWALGECCKLPSGVHVEPWRQIHCWYILRPRNVSGTKILVLLCELIYPHESKTCSALFPKFAVTQNLLLYGGLGYHRYNFSGNSMCTAKITITLWLTLLRHRLLQHWTNSATGFGGRCKCPQWGTGKGLDINIFFDRKRVWWQRFWFFLCTQKYPYKSWATDQARNYTCTGTPFFNLEAWTT